MFYNIIKESDVCSTYVHMKTKGNPENTQSFKTMKINKSYANI